MSRVNSYIKWDVTVIKSSLSRNTVGNKELSQLLKSCVPWKGPTLEQFLESCSLREGATLEESMKDCIPWEFWSREHRRGSAADQAFLTGSSPYSPPSAQTSRNPQCIQGPFCQPRKDISDNVWHPGVTCCTRLCG